MNELRTNNNFQELSHEETESVSGGFHFVVGFIREGQAVANFGLNFVSAVAEATDSVLGRFTGSNGSNESNGSNGSGLFGGSGLLGGLFGRR